MVPSEPPIWARRDGADWLLELHVQPGAKLTAAVGEHGGRLKLKIAAPPVDNKANAHLLRLAGRATGGAEVSGALGAGRNLAAENRGGVWRRRTLA